MENENVTGGQVDLSGTPINVNADNTNATSKADSDYKRSMLKHKDRANELEEKLKAYELEEEERKGNYSKVIDELKTQLHSTKQELVTRDFTYSSSNIDNALKQEAMKHGCKDPALLVKLIGDTKKEIITLDSGFNPNNQEIKDTIENAIKEFDHIGLFGKNVKFADGLPVNTGINTQPTTPVDKMTTKQKEEYLLSNF